MIDPQAEFLADFHRQPPADAMFADAQLQRLFARFVELNERARREVENLLDRLLLHRQRDGNRHPHVQQVPRVDRQPIDASATDGAASGVLEVSDIGKAK